jgi:hypothetical protein
MSTMFDHVWLPCRCSSTTTCLRSSLPAATKTSWWTRHSYQCHRQQQQQQQPLHQQGAQHQEQHQRLVVRLVQQQQQQQLAVCLRVAMAASTSSTGLMASWWQWAWWTCCQGGSAGALRWAHNTQWGCLACAHTCLCRSPVHVNVIVPCSSVELARILLRVCLRCLLIAGSAGCLFESKINWPVSVCRITCC